MAEAGTISLPSAGNRSPAENIALAEGATTAEIMKISTSPGGSLSDTRYQSGNAGSGQRRREARAAALAKAKAEAEAKLAAAKKAEEERKKKEAEAAIAAAKTFAEKQQIARSYVDTKRAELERRKILQTRAKLIGQGAKEQKVTSRDIKTGDELVVTQWRLRNGNRVERIENKTQGTITYSSFARPKAGGSVVRTGGVTVGGGPTVTESAKVEASKVKISTISGTDKKKVVLPSGLQFNISSTGTIKVGKNYAGKDYMFKDGVLIAINGKTTEARDEYVSEPSVEAVAREEKTIARWSKNIKDLRGEASTQRARGNISGINESKLLGWAFLGTLLDGGRALVGLPSAVVNIIKNPSVLKQLPGGISKAGKNFGILLRTSPSEAFGVIAGEIVVLKGTNFAIKQVGKLSSAAFTRLNPKYVGKAALGRNLNIKTGGGKSVNLEVVGKIPKEKLLSQVNKQGKKLTAISSQADDIIFRQKIKGLIRKPIPGEAGFNTATKTLLKKLDDGVITKSELFDLDLLVRSQGSKGLLERAFFADPTGKIRPSRLGVVDSNKAGLLDYLSGDITFKKAKPQLFLFEDIEIDKFPSYLKKVASKIKKNKVLTRAEANALLEWYIKPTGKFKPVGFISGESEITLAPGEILKKVKTVGVTSVKGRRVPIIKVEVLKQSKIMKSLIKKLDDGIITATERARLNRMLKTQTGFNYGLSSNPAVSAKYVPIRRIGYTLLSSVASKLKAGKKYKRLSSKPRLVSRSGKSLRTYKSKGKISKPTSKKTISKKGTSRKVKSKKSSPKKPSPKSPKKIISPKSPYYPGKTPKPIPFKLPKGFTKRKLTKKTPVYYVVIRRKGKLVKLNARPLTLRDARDYGAYRVDNGLSRSFWFEPIGETNKVVGLPRNIRNYYSKISNQLRPFKIRRGKKKIIRRGYIEKSKHIASTRSEVLALQRARRIAKLKRKSTKTKAKTSPRKAPVKRKVVKRRVIRPKKRIVSAKSKRLIKNKKLVNKSQKKKKRVVKKKVKRKIVKKKIIKKKRRKTSIFPSW